jgi:hypothetical protein
VTVKDREITSKRKEEDRRKEKTKDLASFKVVVQHIRVDTGKYIRLHL